MNGRFTMADLKQALIWLAEGKKVFRKIWKDHPSHYICLKDGFIQDEEGLEHFISAYDDWELYEEPKNNDKKTYDEIRDEKIAELEKRVSRCENHLCLQRFI